MKKIAALLFSMIIGIISFTSAQATFDTVTITFDINKHEISEAAQKDLTLLAVKLNVMGGQILVYGYADYLGTPRPNDTLSTQRAHAVKDFLVSKGVPLDRFIQVAGMGQVAIKNPDEVGNIRYRRVDIFIRKKSNSSSLPTIPNIPEPKETVGRFTTKPNNIIDFKKYKVNETIVLDNILFYESRSHIMPTSMGALNELVIALKENPTIKIVLEGHICCVKLYPDAFDKVQLDYHLSRNRAKLIYDYLIEQGIDKNRLDYIGYGNKRPLISPEMSEEDAQKNRRVEVRIVEM